jgi:hypothetical protein
METSGAPSSYDTAVERYLLPRPGAGPVFRHFTMPGEAVSNSGVLVFDWDASHSVTSYETLPRQSAMLLADLCLSCWSKSVSYRIQFISSMHVCLVG